MMTRSTGDFKLNIIINWQQQQQRYIKALVDKDNSSLPVAHVVMNQGLPSPEPLCKYHFMSMNTGRMELQQIIVITQ